MFVNPVSVTNTNYEIASLNLIKPMPESILTQIEKATQSEENGAKIMELILPHYYSNIDHKPGGPFNLNLATYLSVNAQLTEFDYSDQLKQMKNLCAVIGEDDFITLDLIDELILAASSHYVIKSAGHFPFHESREEFQNIVNNIFAR